MNIAKRLGLSGNIPRRTDAASKARVAKLMAELNAKVQIRNEQIRRERIAAERFFRFRSYRYV